MLVPTTEGDEDIVPNASFSLLGGTDIVCLGAGTEGKESGIVWRAIELMFSREVH